MVPFSVCCQRRKSRSGNLKVWIAAGTDEDLTVRLATSRAGRHQKRRISAEQLVTKFVADELHTLVALPPPSGDVSEQWVDTLRDYRGKIMGLGVMRMSQERPGGSWGDRIRRQHFGTSASRVQLRGRLMLPTRCGLPCTHAKYAHCQGAVS